MNITLQYYERVQALLCRIVESQMDSLNRAATLVADTIARDGIVYALGSGHSLLPAAELYYRAGGMAPCDIVHDRTFGRAERLPGYAEVLLDTYPIGPKDALIIISNSGRNCLPVELALGARKRCVSTIGITSLPHSRSVSSRTPQGLKLFEVCDVTIDTGSDPGDASISLNSGSGITVCPTSTLAAVFIVNAISGSAAQQLLERGIEPPVFLSANIDGADETNARHLEFMRQRVRGL